MSFTEVADCLSTLTLLQYSLLCNAIRGSKMWTRGKDEKLKGVTGSEQRVG
jgi:hypothetical protein